MPIIYIFYTPINWYNAKKIHAPDYAILSSLQGWIGATELYYGAYSSGDINVFSSNDTSDVFGLTYDMPTAYFYTMVCSYGLILVVISIR